MCAGAVDEMDGSVGLSLSLSRCLLLSFSLSLCLSVFVPAEAGRLAGSV